MSGNATSRFVPKPAAATLRPMQPNQQDPETIEDTERARAGLYRLLSVLLADPPSTAVLDHLRTIDGDGHLGALLRTIADVARDMDLVSARAEYDALFIGISQGEVIPYASFYLTGFLHDRPLARIRADMAEFGIVRVSERSDPEDHIATVFDVMASLIDGSACAIQPLLRQHGFFRRHIESWVGRLFADLNEAPSARFYRAVAALGQALVALEQEAFLMEFA
jgi:TorA maturation chaperone TorD